MHHLVEFTPGRDSFDAIDDGRGLPALHLLDKIAERVQQQDEANRAFLLMGFAARLFEHAGRSADVDGYGKEAHKYIEKISRDSAAIHINSKAVCRLLAEPPLDESSARTKIERASQPLVVLFIAADPRDAQRLDTLGEMADLHRTVRASVLPGSMRVAICPGGRISELGAYLDIEKPSVVHYSGHGTKEGFWFRNDRGGTAKVDPAAFARLLAKHHQKGLRAVVMNACYTADQAQLLADATGHAVAMDGQLSDSGAIAFTKHFYGSMGAGNTFEVAFDEAADAMRLDPDLSALSPKLFKRVEVDQSPPTIAATPINPSAACTPSIITDSRQAGLAPSSTGTGELSEPLVASPTTPLDLQALAITTNLREAEESSSAGNIWTGDTLAGLSTEARKQFAIGVVRQNPKALANAPPDIQADKAVLMEAIKVFPPAVEYASESLRSNVDFMTEVVSHSSRVLIHGSPKIRGYRQVVLEAVKQNPMALEHASADLKKDEEIVLEAVKRSPLALRHADKSFRDDPNFMAKAVSHVGSLLELASPEVRGCKDVVIAAIKQDPMALEFASEELRGDREVVIEAVKRHLPALMYASEGFRGNVNCMTAVVQENGLALAYAAPILQGDDMTTLVEIDVSGGDRPPRPPIRRATKRIRMRARLSAESQQQP
ncbi:hypothetical protein EHS25_006569 [Saitozyma podzolica]|uniref:CHAT domain-containing protein n=1 Tax=Saitozyma podzolica TaxID=1890683 RepID=A0A427YS68_9TREE|nr:hypothetical protein EHS25_006569 [Saitozyma podzolica]